MRNPAKLLQLKKQYEAFVGRHPKFIRYLAYITDHYVELAIHAAALIEEILDK